MAEEIDPGCGIADLVVATGRPGDGLPFRRAAGSQLQLLLLERCAGAGASVEELRQWAPHGWRGLFQRSVVPLLESGHLAEVVDEFGLRFVSTVAVGDPFAHLVAVELKLRDWRKGIAQAGRYRLFAECSYIALPAARVTTKVLDEAGQNQVGVLAVGDDGSVTRSLPAVYGPALQPQRRRWASELVLSWVRDGSARSAGSPIVARQVS